MLAFLLSGENLHLAETEVMVLTKGKKRALIDNILVVDTSYNTFKRLAYTKRVYTILFESTPRELKKDIERFDWNAIYKKNFSVRVSGGHPATFTEKNLASLIWYRLETPSVNLTNAKTNIEFLFFDKKIYACLGVYTSRHAFNERKAHVRPALHPVSLHPKLARALVNLTGITEGTIVDPFCGTAGILLEAGLMGFKTIGYDINTTILRKAKKNLDFFKIKQYELEVKNALELGEVDYVVTDLPYGRNTKKLNLSTLYGDFLAALKKVLRKKAIVVFPYDVTGLIQKAGLTIEGTFTYYVHKSMSKSIYVLS